MLAIKSGLGLSPKILKIYSHILVNPNLSILDLANELKLSRTSLYKYLKELQSKGFVFKDNITARWKANHPDIPIENLNLELKLLRSSLSKFDNIIKQNQQFRLLETRQDFQKSLSHHLHEYPNALFLVGDITKADPQLLSRLRNNTQLSILNIKNNFNLQSFTGWWSTFLPFASLLIIEHYTYLIFTDGPSILINDRAITNKIKNNLS